MFLFFLFLFCLSPFFSIFMHLFIYLFCFYFLLKRDSSFSNMFYTENNFKKLLYFCLIRCRFEVWKKKTNRILFSSMVFFLFLLLFFFVSSFLSFIFKFSFKIILLYFPFLFHV